MRRGAWLVAWVLILIGCSTNDRRAPESVRRLQGVPVLEGAMREPGTELGDGFTVAPGSVLIADVFPPGYTPTEDRGWLAYLLVTGDPREVIRHYQQEARRVGMRWSAAGSRPPDSFLPGPAPAISRTSIASSASSTTTSMTTPPPTPAPTGFCRTDPNEGYVCVAAGVADEDDRARSVRLDLTRRSGTAPGQRGLPQSYARLRYFDTDAHAGFGADSGLWLMAPNRDDPPPPPLPDDWTTPARPGDRIDSGLPRTGPITIEADSRAAIPTIVEADFFGHDIPLVILRIDGDPDAVLRGYGRQFARLLGESEPPPIRRRSDNGVTVLDMSVGGDDSMLISAFVRDGKPTWATLTTAVGT